MPARVKNASRAQRWLAPAAGRQAVAAALAALSVVALGATAAHAAPGVVPNVAASSTSAARASDTPPRALPRQFSIEVGPGGVLVADGTRLGASSELERWAQRALAGARFSGAVVFGDEARDGALVGEVVERLRRVGFAEVRRAGRPAPPPFSALATSGPPPVIKERAAPAATGGASASGVAAAAAQRSPSTPPAVAPPSSSRRAPPRRAPAVTLATVGLHVDGVLAQEPHRRRLVRTFEGEFKAFRRCHERAERHEEGASYGVDLLIPKDGGRGKVRQTRTRLTSKAFRTCMQSAFESIRFAPLPSGRPEIVSYSVLFKPTGR